MSVIIRTEFKKIRRVKIISVGIISIILSIIISSIQIISMSNDVIHFSYLLNMIIWNNVTIILPFSLTLIGGYLINREYAADTIKNFLVIPICWSKVMKAKICVMLIGSLFLGFLNGIGVILTGLFLKCAEFNIQSIINVFKSLEIMYFCMYIGILPIILFFSRAIGKYIWGAILSMIIGVVGIFVANGNLVNIHPITAGFSIISYSMIPDGKLNIVISSLSLILYSLLSYIIYLFGYKKKAN